MTFAGTGRNDPCPCGSGKKFKRCCMPAGGARPAVAPPPPDRATLLRRAGELFDAGRLELAAESLERLLRRNERDADALVGLALVRARAQEHHEALRLLRRALALRPEVPMFHAHLAGVLLANGRAEEALPAAERAAALDGNEVAALRLLARVRERLGRLGEAAAAARRALELAPRDVESALVLARVDRREGRLEAARDRLREVVEWPGARDQRHVVWKELGATLDRAGEVDAAFEAFVASARERASKPDARALAGDAWRARLQAYRALDLPALLARRPREGFGDGLPAPSFLVGFPRSGTTLTEQVLAAHPRVVTSDERTLLHPLKHEIERRVPGDTPLPARLERLEQDDLRALRRLYVEGVERALGAPLAGRVHVDKLPLNLIDAVLIDYLFPEAKLILALRDPRDACLSCFMQDFDLNAAMVNFLDLERTVDFYSEVMDTWLAAQPHLQLAVLPVRYEDTLADLEGQARRLVAFLELEWDDAVLAYRERAAAREISTPSYAAVAEPLYARAAGRWRRYRAHLEAPFAPLARFARTFGYED